MRKRILVWRMKHLLRQLERMQAKLDRLRQKRLDLQARWSE